MKTMKAAVLFHAEAVLGECPRWHVDEQRLYWVDIARSELHRLDPVTGAHDCRAFAVPVGCFAFRKDRGLILGMKDGLAALADWDARPEPFGEQFLSGRPDLRLNDGRTDPAGRFWVGSANTAKSAHDAALYRADPDGNITLVQNAMLTCNGAAFTADGGRFHHADTPSHRLRAYDADPATGLLTNERVLHRFPDGQGRPDGGSFDMEGNYWSALFDGGRVVKLSPEGDILATVRLPVPRPTMIAFGGRQGRTAFITTARTGLSPEALAEAPLSGSLFTFDVDVPGVPEWDFG